jgi:predicted glycoside hydrolase/deacetylase ChbG (UPF0249 family)
MMANENDLNRRTFLKSLGLSVGTASLLPLSAAQKGRSKGSLVQRLGYPADARVLILTADEFGECHAANMGIIQCWEAGLLKGTTLVAPGPWAPEAVEYVRKHPEFEVGVHLTLATGNVSGIGYRPLLSRAEVPGLYNPEGYMWPYGDITWEHATADQVKRESRAQIEQVLHWGIKPTHIDPHDGIFNLPRAHFTREPILEFAKLYGELAKEFSVPVRMSYTPVLLKTLGLTDMPEIITKMGVIAAQEGYQAPREPGDVLKLMRDQAPGTVREIYIHPVVDSPEARAVRIERDWWKTGVNNLALFTTGRDEVQKVIKEEGLIVIGWSKIRDLQRSGG